MNENFKALAAKLPFTHFQEESAGDPSKHEWRAEILRLLLIECIWETIEHKLTYGPAQTDYFQLHFEATVQLFRRYEVSLTADDFTAHFNPDWGHSLVKWYIDRFMTYEVDEAFIVRLVTACQLKGEHVTEVMHDHLFYTQGSETFTPAALRKLKKLNKAMGGPRLTAKQDDMAKALEYGREQVAFTFQHRLQNTNGWEWLATENITSTDDYMRVMKRLLR